MDRTYPATAETIEESHLLYLPSEALAEAISANENLAMNLLAHLARYLQILTRKVEELSLMDAAARFTQHVLSEMDPVTGLVRLSAGKGQMAVSLGMAVETFSRILTRLKDEGIIKEASPGILQVLDREALKKPEGSLTRLSILGAMRIRNLSCPLGASLRGVVSVLAINSYQSLFPPV